MNHDEKLHEAIVYVAGSCALQDEDILVTNGLAHGDLPQEINPLRTSNPGAGFL